MWVPRTSVPSCDLLIFVDQASEQADASHLFWWSGGVVEPVEWLLAEGAVWPMSVVVRDVGIQDRGQVAPTEDQDPVGAFAPDRANPAFGESVRAGARIGVRMIVICSKANTVSKPVTNLASQPGSGTQLFDSITEIHKQIANLLSHPRPGRVGRDAREVHPAGTQFEEEQDIEPAQEYRVDGKKIASHDRGSLGVE